MEGVQRGRGRSTSFVNDLEDDSGAAREQQLLQKVANKYVDEHPGVANELLGEEDGDEAAEARKTQLPRKMLDIVTNLDKYRSLVGSRRESSGDGHGMERLGDEAGAFSSRTAETKMKSTGPSSRHLGDQAEDEGVLEGAGQDRKKNGGMFSGIRGFAARKRTSSAEEVNPDVLTKKNAKQKDYDYYVKVLLLGDSGVGKTSLMCRFADNKFQPNLMSTAGVDFRIRYLRRPNKASSKNNRVKCQIWDTAGQERFHVITRAYYRDAQGIALVYDVTNERSFEQISYWMTNIKNHAGNDVVVVLFGNKVDLESRKISYEQGAEIAKQYNALFYETSAKDGTNVVDAFQALSEFSIGKIDEKSGVKPPPKAGATQHRGVQLKSKKKVRCSVM